MTMATTENRDLERECYDLFVLAGQSHLVGLQGDAVFYPTDAASADTSIPFYFVEPGRAHSNGWTNLRPQPGLYPAGHFGPEICFARALRGAGLNPAIFKYALESTSIAEDWLLPGHGGLYDLMRIELEKACRLRIQTGDQLRFRAFVWLQGESDARTTEMADAYHERLKTLLQHFRTTYAGLGLMTILCSDEQHPFTKKHPAVIQAQKSVCTELPETVYFSMGGLEKQNGNHLSPDGINKHGQRIFDVYRLALKHAAHMRKSGGTS